MKRTIPTSRLMTLAVIVLVAGVSYSAGQLSSNEALATQIGQSPTQPIADRGDLLPRHRSARCR